MPRGRAGRLPGHCGAASRSPASSGRCRPPATRSPTAARSRARPRHAVRPIDGERWGEISGSDSQSGEPTAWLSWLRPPADQWAGLSSALWPPPRGLRSGGARYAKSFPGEPMGAKRGVHLRQCPGGRGGATQLLQRRARKKAPRPYSSPIRIWGRGPLRPIGDRGWEFKLTGRSVAVGGSERSGGRSRCRAMAAHSRTGA